MARASVWGGIGYEGWKGLSEEEQAQLLWLFSEARREETRENGQAMIVSMVHFAMESGILEGIANVGSKTDNSQTTDTGLKDAGQEPIQLSNLLNGV